MRRRRRLIEKVTEAEVEVSGEAMRDVTFVIIEEVKPTNWAVGGTFPKFKASG